VSDLLEKNERHAFRLLAENKEVVEEIIFKNLCCSY
jgi:hypothetical protein